MFNEFRLKKELFLVNSDTISYIAGTAASQIPSPAASATQPSTSPTPTPNPTASQEPTFEVVTVQCTA